MFQADLDLAKLLRELQAGIARAQLRKAEAEAQEAEINAERARIVFEYTKEAIANDRKAGKFPNFS